MFGIAGVDGNGQTELFEVLAGLRRHPAAGPSLRTAATCPRFTVAGVGRRHRLHSADRLRPWAGAVDDRRRERRRVQRRACSRLTAARLSSPARLDAFAAASDRRIRRTRSAAGNSTRRLRCRAATCRSWSSPARWRDAAARAGRRQPDARPRHRRRRSAVYAALRRGAGARRAPSLLISTDLDEIARARHRVAVLYRGRLSAPLEPAVRRASGSAC